jgi:hypothetical protein
VSISKRSTKEENILSRLRVGQMLNKTLKQINKHPTGLCEQCRVECCTLEIRDHRQA